MLLMLQRPLQRGNFFLRGRDARTIGAVQRTKQHFFLYFQFLYFLGQLSNAAWVSDRTAFPFSPQADFSVPYFSP